MRNALTGDRSGSIICNDCMKSCIYQKQDPVDIPQAETRTLKDVLELPWGFEIYSLFTRWNPFDLRRPYPKPATGRRVLIVGLGPAGFGPARFVTADGVFPYRIDFENEPAATGPAQFVTITDPLDPNLDWRTFELTEVGFGDTKLTAQRIEPMHISARHHAAVDALADGVFIQVQHGGAPILSRAL